MKTPQTYRYNNKPFLHIHIIITEFKWLVEAAGVRVAQSLVFCVVFCRPLFVLLFFVFYVLLLDWPFSIFSYFCFLSDDLILGRMGSDLTHANLRKTKWQKNIVEYVIKNGPNLWKNICYYQYKPHLWCNGSHAPIECCRSWVRVNLKPMQFVFAASPQSVQH